MTLLRSGAVLSLAAAIAFTTTMQTQIPSGAVLIHTSKLIDGKGKTLTNADIVVEGGKITHIGGKQALPKGGREIDLRGKTVLPGLIDAHVHLNWYFNAKGRYHSGGDGEGAPELKAAMEANAKATLLAGFTTVQSPGAMQDLDLRARIAAGDVPGPRLLTSVQQLQGRMPRGTTAADSQTARDYAETLRNRIRQVKTQGGDLVKLFASGSIRDGGQLSMTQDQLNAACDEAKKNGLRTIVHAHSVESLHAVINAGCDQIEHGVFATQTELDMMVAHNVYFDPQCSLVFRNYLDNRDKYNGIGNFNDEGFASMEKALPLAAEVIRKANATKGLKVLYGTDAVAGAHGRNAEDLVCWVQSAHVDAMRALTAATSLNAEAMRLGDKIGALAPGMEADIIALDGDPLTDITAVRRVAFVMKGGTVFKGPGAPQ